MTITDPFPSIQKAVNKALRNPVNASKKQASSIEDINGAKVFVNPTLEQTKGLLEKSKDHLLRAILDPATGDLYFWDAWMADHAGIVHYFGLPIDVETVAAGDNYLWTIGDGNEIDYLFQKRNRRLRRLPKQAAISGHIVNDILEVVESSGGITYNMNQGNLAYSDNYSVSIYPQREKIVTGVADYEDIQNYINENEDLLIQPNNSFGVWSNKGQVYYDIVITIPDREEALKLGRENNQLEIWDLKNMVGIPTGIVRAFSKKDIVKKAIIKKDRPYIDAHISGDLVWIDMIHVPKEDRGKGIGTKLYKDWEAKLPKNIKLVRIMAADTDGSGTSDNFWKNLGFNYTYGEGRESLDYEYQQWMQKGVNGHPDPEPIVVDKTASLNKKAEESSLTEQDQNEIAAKWTPLMNIALNNYADAVKNGHAPERAFKYALSSTENLGKIQPANLQEAINTYLGPVK